MGYIKEDKVGRGEIQLRQGGGGGWNKAKPRQSRTALGCMAQRKVVVVVG